MEALVVVVGGLGILLFVQSFLCWLELSGIRRALERIADQQEQ